MQDPELRASDHFLRLGPTEKIDINMLLEVKAVFQLTLPAPMSFFECLFECVSVNALLHDCMLDVLWVVVVHAGAVPGRKAPDHHDAPVRDMPHQRLEKGQDPPLR